MSRVTKFLEANVLPPLLAYLVLNSHCGLSPKVIFSITQHARVSHEAGQRGSGCVPLRHPRPSNVTCKKTTWLFIIKWLFYIHIYIYICLLKRSSRSSNSQKFIREYLLAKLKTTRIFQWCHDRIKLRWFFLNGVLLHFYSRSQWFDMDFKATLFLFIYTVALCDWQFFPCLNLNPIFVSITGFGNISRKKKAKMTAWRK